MNKMLLAAVLLSAIGAGSAIAQLAPTPAVAPPTTPVAIAAGGATTTAATTATTSPAGPVAGPVAGANSFTMGQAQKRMEDQGYTQVTGLAKDDQSIWRGQAMKDSKAVNIALDYQGNITTN